MNVEVLRKSTRQHLCCSHLLQDSTLVQFVKLVFDLKYKFLFVLFLQVAEHCGGDAAALHRWTSGQPRRRHKETQ